MGAFTLPGIFGDVMDKFTGANKVDPSKTNNESAEETDEKKKGFFSFLRSEKKEEKVVNPEDNLVSVSSDDILKNLTPNKNNERVATISNPLDNNPEITTIPLSSFNKQRQEIASSSKQRSKPSLNISAEDKNNQYVVFAEAEFNMF